MNKKPKIPISWTEDHLKFIRDNYYQMTWTELCQAVKEINKTATIQALRHQCHRMKLSKQIQIRWSKIDIQFLIDNYKTMGNVEMAEILTTKGRSFRIIDGEKAVRMFVPKHIEKKMVLLGLERTQEDLDYIKKHNLEIGKGWQWTKKSNVYTQGFRTLFPEGTVRVWGKDYKQKWIKIGSKYTQYSRHQYEKHNGPITPGFNVWFKDGDPLNCEPENLYLVPNEEQTVERQARNYPEEYREIIRLNSRLNRQINKITNK